MHRHFMIAALVIALGSLAVPALAAYPQTLTVVSPFVNLPRPDWDPLWAEAFSHWDKRAKDKEVFAAVKIFEALMRAHPDKAETHLWLCRSSHMAAMRSKDPARTRYMKISAQEADRALKIDPENDYARYWRYGAIVLVRDFTAEEFAEIRGWARQFDHLRELPVPEDDPLWAEAMTHWDRRLEVPELEKTIAIFLELDKKYPNRIEPKLWLTRAYYWMHYHEATEEGKAKWCLIAMDWGQKAVDLEPLNPAANYWSAAAVGQYCSSSGFQSMVKYALEIAAKLKVVGEEDMNYYYGGLSQYFALAIVRSGQLVAKTAEVLGFSGQDIERLTVFAYQYEPRYLRNLYALGELYLHQEKMDLAKKFLELTVNSDPAALKNFEPDNRIAQKLARELLEKHF